MFKHAIAIGLLVAATTLVHGQGREPARSEIRGILKSVDATSITLAISAGRETPAVEKTYDLSKNVEICLGGAFRVGIYKEGKIADLSPGSLIGISLTADQKRVDCIVAEEPTVRGVLKAVDAKKRTLTVSQSAGREVADQETSYTVAANAEIAIDDGRGRRFSLKEGKLDELAEGAIVTLRLSLDKKNVQSIVAEGATLNGIVKAIDAAKNSLTLTVGPARGAEAGEERLLKLAADAVVLIDDGKGRRLSIKEAKLADVPVGAAVIVKFAVDQSFVMMLRAAGPSLTGMLKAIDADKGTLTIAIPKGRDDAEEKMLKIAKEASVMIDGEAAKLADLKVLDNGPILYLRLSLDQRTVQAITQPRGR